MEADAFYTIGNSHIFCQDYARAGRVNDSYFAMVSDGCSGSLHSDLGARLLVTGAIQQLKLYGNIFEPKLAAILAASSSHLLELNLTALDATLLCAVASNGNIKITVSGDGVIAARRKDGKIESWEIDFVGAPAYISYLLDQDRLNHYLEMGFGKRKVIHSIGGRVKEVCYFPQVSIAQDFICTIELKQDEYDAVLLLSDGASSFYKKENDLLPLAVPLFYVLEQLMAFKNTKGEFIIRRCNRFLLRFCPSVGWQHNDDLAVAGIYCGGGGGS